MATKLCPNCKADAFAWAMDDEYSPFTTWGCFNCGYVAYEDESLKRKCSCCGQKTESKLSDKTKQYWWCSNCNRITIIEELK